MLREDRPIRHAVQTDRTSSSKLPITVVVTPVYRTLCGSMRGVLVKGRRGGRARDAPEMRKNACCSPITGRGSDDCSSFDSQLPDVYWRLKIQCVWFSVMDVWQTIEPRLGGTN